MQVLTERKVGRPASEVGKLADQVVAVRVPQNVLDALDAMPRKDRGAWIRRAMLDALQKTIP